jgi:glycosyltransferase involved in cell wall biosynthesis
MVKKIKILFIIDYLYGWSGGGTETHLLSLTRLLDKKKFDCFIIAFDTGATPLTKKFNEIGVNIIHVPVGKFYTPNALWQAIKISRLIQNLKIDIVQTFHFKSDTYGVLTAKLSGAKNIISSKRDIGDIKSKWHYWLNTQINHYIDGFIVVADAVGNVVKEKENVPNIKIITIYNGVDINKFYPASVDEYTFARKNLDIKFEDFVVGMVAVFRREKNHEILLDTARKISEIIKEIKIILVGGGPLLESYKEYCKRNGLSDKVIFSGPTLDVKQYLNAFDVACLVPSSNEGFSNSVLEKMAMGLPLIVTDVGGNSEAVRHGYNGIVIPAGDADALCAALLEMYRNPNKRKQMGQNSRIRAEQEFSIKQMIKKYEEYYEYLMFNKG